MLGGGSLTLNPYYIGGLVPSPVGGSLWVSDTFNHRVLRIRNPLTSPVVDVVLGQTDASGNQCNRGLVPPPNTGTDLVADATMLCNPGALSFDKLGNLFVSDDAPEIEGNWRLLRFAGGLFPTSASTTLFDVPATKIFPYRGGQPAITFEPAFDSANRMVVGYNSYLGGNFVGVYNDPPGPGTDPDTYLNDFGSWPSGVAFDANDNLYVGDANRARLLVYHKPLVHSLLQSLSPARIWVGLKNGDDVGTNFDLKAEVLRSSTVIGSGQIDNVPGGGSGFGHAALRTIGLVLSSTPVPFASGETLSIRLSVRIGATGHRSGTARLWYGDAQANSHFDATIDAVTSDYYLRDGFVLGTSAGPGPMKTIDVFADRLVGGNPFKPFGTWSVTLP